MPIAQLAGTTVGKPFRYKTLSIFPLSLPIVRHNGTRIADDTLEVSEVGGGVVGQLQVHNPGDVDLLIPAGRVLEGGRQTRTVNVSILVPAKKTLVIPVSCVEEGRWDLGTHFRNSGRYSSRRVRMAKERGVKANLDDHGGKESDQSVVWESIDDELCLRRIVSPSSLYLSVDHYIDESDELTEILREALAVGIQPGQTGVALAHGGVVLGMELFTSEDDLRASWEALVRMAILDTETEADASGDVTERDIERFLAEVASMETTTVGGTGLGTEYHAADEHTVAHALVDDDGNLIHAFAFASA